jgi:ABC-2 type transport system ATP-binding protein
MSIIVKDLTKIYGSQRAIDSISFEIKSGEVVGFLGPNGAGKSTTMKILTCFIPPTSGEASVCGIRVDEDPFSVKQKVGYLPENNPLYLDMYVKEYLQFIAGIHRLPNKKQSVSNMIDAVGLELEQHKKIGALSKGYRQRVGLAQAMIHDPEVLILDEPTSGLDPNQLEDIRALIVKIGKQKTVMLSTHIMQEVEAICNRIIIINRGHIVANDQASVLQQANTEHSVIYVEFEKPTSKTQLAKIPGVTSCKEVGQNSWLIEAASGDDIRSVISKFGVENQNLVLTLRKEQQSLEEVFKKLTKGKN